MFVSVKMWLCVCVCVCVCVCLGTGMVQQFKMARSTLCFSSSQTVWYQIWLRLKKPSSMWVILDLFLSRLLSSKTVYIIRFWCNTASQVPSRQSLRRVKELPEVLSASNGIRLSPLLWLPSRLDLKGICDCLVTLLKQPHLPFKILPAALSLLYPLPMILWISVFGPTVTFLHWLIWVHAL